MGFFPLYYMLFDDNATYNAHPHPTRKLSVPLGAQRTAGMELQALERSQSHFVKARPL